MIKKTKSTEKKSIAPQDTDGASLAVPEDGIGSRIRAARDAKGWSQTDLANLTKEIDPQRKGVSRTVLVGYEGGQFKPAAREIRILCETLSITPNWLIFGSDFAGGTEQVSMEAARKNGLFAAMRVALAIGVLKSHERTAFQSLVLSMAGRELGDRKLSALFGVAAALAMPGFEVLQKELADPELMSKNISEVLQSVLNRDDVGFLEWGNKLKLHENGEISGDWLYPEPERSSK